MKYLPFENITYYSKLGSEEIIRRICDVVEPQKTSMMIGFFRSNNRKPYEGSISGNSFGISRIIGYRNSFLPRIEGNVVESFGKTKVTVKMRVHPLVTVFMFLWFGGVGIGCFAVMVSMWGNQNVEAISLIPFGMLIFGYTLFTGGFKYESTKSKKYFAELFEADIEE